MQPVIAVGIHIDKVTGIAYHQYRMEYVRYAVALAGRIDILLQRYGFAASQAFIGGNQDRGLAVCDTTSQRVRGEATKYNRVNSPDSCTGQHRYSSLGDHRHIQCNAVPAPGTQTLQYVGHPAYTLM